MVNAKTNDEIGNTNDEIMSQIESNDPSRTSLSIGCSYIRLAEGD
jgi:hypothetical protein